MNKHPRSISAQRDQGEQSIRRGEASFISRFLDPIDVVVEVLTGTIMALSFTLGSSLIVKGGRDATKEMLLGVLGCNVAWGIIDGAICLMIRMLDRSRKSRLLEAIREARGGESAVAIVATELEPKLAGLASRSDLDHFYRSIAAHLSHLAPEQAHLERQDFYSALVTFGFMCGTTIPAIAPFFVLRDLNVALRVSNSLLLTMLFLFGYRWGRITRSNPWVSGSALLVIGLAMVVVSIWLEP